MINFIEKFRTSEDGAVTVDWVVLTAAIIGVAFACGTVVFTATVDRAEIVAQSIPDDVTTY